MKISKERLAKLYQAIHSAIIDVRVELRLPGGADVVLAQVEHKIWHRVCRALKIPKT